MRPSFNLIRTVAPPFGAGLSHALIDCLLNLPSISVSSVFHRDEGNHPHFKVFLSTASLPPHSALRAIYRTISLTIETSHYNAFALFLPYHTVVYRAWTCPTKRVKFTTCCITVPVQMFKTTSTTPTISPTESPLSATEWSRLHFSDSHRTRKLL